MDPAAVSIETTTHSANTAHGSSGTSTDNGGELLRVLEELSRQLHRVSFLNSGFSPAASPSSAVWAVPVFRGFQDDAFLWIETNSLGDHHAWADQQKWLVAIDHLRDAAKAWHAYEGIRQQTWPEWCAKLKSLFHSLFRDGDSLPTDRVTTTHGSHEVHHLDGAARAFTSLPSLYDLDCEGRRPDGAIVPCTNEPSLRYRVPEGQHRDDESVSCSFFTPSFAEHPATDTDKGHKVGFAAEDSNSASRPTSRPSLPETKIASMPQKSMTPTGSSSLPWHMEMLAPLTVNTVQKPNESMPAIIVNALSDPPELHT